VPDDIITIMMKSLGLVSLTAEGYPATLAPLPALPKTEFLDWLIHDLGLGKVRVEEYEQKILTYTVYDRKVKENAPEVIESPAMAAAQTPTNGEATVPAY
jgi:hypothetical protein